MTKTSRYPWKVKAFQRQDCDGLTRNKKGLKESKLETFWKEEIYQSRVCAWVVHMVDIVEKMRGGRVIEIINNTRAGIEG